MMAQYHVTSLKIIVHSPTFCQVGMPADFINKLSRMFQDIKVSEDLNNQFKEQQKDRDTKTGDSV